MAALQRVSQSSVSNGASGHVSCKTGSQSVDAGEKSPADQFPAGLRVLVVDDDVTCLRIAEQMLRRCLYLVTTCSKAAIALKLLREKKGYFDLVLSDVYMPDIDGYTLLEQVGLGMDLPVIMMSSDGSTNAVMKGIRHGACDYLIKPIREEELKNLWQHVVRKKWIEKTKDLEQSGSLDENDRNKRKIDDVEHASSINEETEGQKGPKKRSNNVEEDDSEADDDDPSTSKKPRVVWSVELHQQFVSAVNQLGLDKAVPKRILELMNVPGLTRENVASHLQKFRLYLKRLSGGMSQQQNGISGPFCGSVDPNLKIGSLGRFDLQALAAAGQLPPHTLAALHAELFGQPALLHASLPVDHGLTFGQSSAKSQTSIFKQYPQPIFSVEDAPRFGAWIPNVGPSNSIEGMNNNQNGNLLMEILPHQKQPRQQNSTNPESGRSINVQPSCLVVPNGSSYRSNSSIDYTTLTPQSNNPSFNGVSNGDNRQYVANVHGSYGGAQSRDERLDQGPLRNLGYVGKATFIPTQFAVDEYECSISKLTHQKVNPGNGVNPVKQEPSVDFIDNGAAAMRRFSSNDLMSVITK